MCTCFHSWTHFVIVHKLQMKIERWWRQKTKFFPLIDKWRRRRDLNVSVKLLLIKFLWTLWFLQPRSHLLDENLNERSVTLSLLFTPSSLEQKFYFSCEILIVWIPKAQPLTSHRNHQAIILQLNCRKISSIFELFQNQKTTHLHFNWNTTFWNLKSTWNALGLLNTYFVSLVLRWQGCNLSKLSIKKTKESSSF